MKSVHTHNVAAYFLLILIITSLAGCGGSSSNGSGTGDNAATTTYPVALAYSNVQVKGYQASFDVAGIYTYQNQSTAVSGPVSVSSQITNPNTTFNGQPAFQVTTTVTENLSPSVGTQSISYAGAGTNYAYFSSDNEPLGWTDAVTPTNICLTTAFTKLPTMAVVGAQGPIATFDCNYNNYGHFTVTTSYSVLAGPQPGTVFLKMTTTTSNSLGFAVHSDTVFVSDTEGNVTFWSYEIQLFDGTETFQITSVTPS